MRAEIGGITLNSHEDVYKDENHHVYVNTVYLSGLKKYSMNGYNVSNY